MNIQLDDRTPFPDPSLMIILKRDDEMKLLAPCPVRDKLELCDSGVAFLHLDKFLGNRSHTFGKFAFPEYQVKFLSLDPLAVVAEANSSGASLAENAVSVCPDPHSLRLFDSLEKDLPQRSYGQLSKVFPE